MENINSSADGVHSKLRVWLWIAFAVLVLAGLAYYWWFMKGGSRIYSPGSTAGNATSAGLGADIYNKSANPVQDSLPANPATVQNPLDQVYKNPFQ